MAASDYSYGMTRLLPLVMMLACSGLTDDDGELTFGDATSATTCSVTECVEPASPQGDELHVGTNIAGKTAETSFTEAANGGDMEAVLGTLECVASQ